MEAHLELVQACVRGAGPTVEVAPGSHFNVEGRDIQV